MDTFTTRPDLSELEQIRAEVRRCRSVDDLRWYFERLRVIRSENPDHFELLVAVSTLQNEIVELARELQAGSGISVPVAERHAAAADPIETAPDVQRLDPKTWQRTLYLALFFGLLLFAAFFYLIQTARRLNLTPDSPAAAAVSTPGKPGGDSKTTGDGGSAAEAGAKPLVRLYTDLVPGSVSIDGGPPEDLKDGELELNDLAAGQHSMEVKGEGGSAEFRFEIVPDGPPKLTDPPSATNAMAVLVSSGHGKGRLVANGDQADVMLDNQIAGRAAGNAVALETLDKGDHLLQVSQGRDRQRFVWTYTAAPTLTVYVKADPNNGAVVVLTHEDGAQIFINDSLYRRRTDAGQIRIPLKAGDYTIRVHKAGFIDPPPQRVQVKKGDETAAKFRLDPMPSVATLQIKGALPGTMVYVDGSLAASIAGDGLAAISNIKPGEHSIELRREQAVAKRFDRAFKTGDTVVLSGPDTVLEKTVVANTQNVPAPRPSEAPKAVAQAASPEPAQSNAMQIEGAQVKRGGGFIPYHMPRVAGHYSFAGQPSRSGLLRRGKFSWYAGYQDPQNYVLFVADGKHVSVRQVIDGHQSEVSRVPLNVDPDNWVQVDMTVRPNAITTRVKTPETGWQDVGTVSSNGRDFTQNSVGLYVPGNDEVRVANFRFSNH